ncbi:MAG: EAL domain-containing protein, partial [Lachnospiraceae bacterium]|nr:EAL domain-containing protein [Lachnospiraceae bacterium]
MMGTFYRRLENREMNTDYLTGLYNRRGLLEIWQSLPEDTMVHCLYIDVDNFKLVNDIYGHAKGDELLVFISVLLNQTFQEQLAVRMGGDEFVVFCDGRIARADMEERLHTLQKQLRRGDFDVNVEKILSFSIGVSYSQFVNAGLHDILEQADVAMYQVKKSGKGHFVVYEDIRVQIEEEKLIKERAFRGEIWQELKILYRPVIYIQTSDVYAVETVIQWDFPGKGVFSEEKIMPVLKQYSVDIQLGRHVLETVCAQKQRWRDTEFDKIEFYVRLTGRFLLQKDSIAVIADCMEKYQVGHDEIQICIEENDFGENGEKLYTVAQNLLDLGFKVAINNFASSSLYVLQRIPSQLLKLDAKLLDKTQYSKKSLYILRNVISLGRDLECGIVAQGIENTAQVKMLASYGAQFGVGDFYGMPCDETDFFDQYRDRLFLTHNMRPARFLFAQHLADENGEYTGVYSGEGLTFTTGVYDGQGALRFPGGKVGENCVRLPREVMYSDSYSICFWVNPDSAQPWSSIVYITYILLYTNPSQQHEHEEGMP